MGLLGVVACLARRISVRFDAEILHMKNKNTSNNMWLRIMVVLNTIAVASYIFYGEWEKKQPRMVKHVCQTVAADQDKGLVALTCLED